MSEQLDSRTQPYNDLVRCCILLVTAFAGGCVLRDVTTEVVYRRVGTGVVTRHEPIAFSFPTQGESIRFHEPAAMLLTADVRARPELELDRCDVPGTRRLGRRTIPTIDYVTCDEPDADSLHMPWQDVEIVEHVRTNRGAAIEALAVAAIATSIGVSLRDHHPEAGDALLAGAGLWTVAWLPTLFGADRDTVVR